MSASIRTIRNGLAYCLVAAPLIHVACGDPTDQRAPTLSVAPASVQLRSLSETVRLTAVFRDRDGNVVSDKAVAWSSSSTEVATVDATGLVTAVANGAATVTATVEGYSATATVDVSQAAAMLTIARAPPETFVDVVITPAITVRVLDALGKPMTTSAAVSVELVAPTDGATIAGTSSQTTPNGVALFDLSVNRPGRGYRIKATSGGLTALSEGFDIVGAQEVSVGGIFSCAVATNERIYCWGANSVGQLGAPPGVGPILPAMLPSDKRFVTVSVGGAHACAVTTDREGYCWGWNSEGQVGNGSVAESAPLTRVAGQQSWKVIQSGSHASCALTTEGKAYCWGFNNSGQLGDGTTQNRLEPVEVLGGLTFTAIDTYGSHTCGITADGAAYCWGWNGAGQLGIGAASITPTLSPAPVAGGLRFTSIAVGGSHSCGLTGTGAPRCWGFNDRGQLGTGGASIEPAPAPVGSLTSLTSINAGVFYTCGLTAAGAAHCWGDNGDQQLGDGTSTRRLTPVAVSGGLIFSQLATGFAHTCGRVATGNVYCWGENRSGQLGDGTFTSASSPVRVRWRRASAVRIDSVRLRSTELSLSGAAVPYTIYVSNVSGAALTGLGVQAHINQGAASQAAGGRVADCGEAQGTLGAGRSCSFSFTINAGLGGLSVGPAVAQFHLRSDNGGSDVVHVPITIVP